MCVCVNACLCLQYRQCDKILNCLGVTSSIRLTRALLSMISHSLGVFQNKSNKQTAVFSLSLVLLSTCLPEVPRLTQKLGHNGRGQLLHLPGTRHHPSKPIIVSVRESEGQGQSEREGERKKERERGREGGRERETERKRDVATP